MPKYMLTVDEVKTWVAQGGGWCPFCQSESIKYVGTHRAINALNTVQFLCLSCHRKHFAIYQGDALVDLTHDQVEFRMD